MARNALGRGLSALIRDAEPVPSAPPPLPATPAAESASGGISQVDIDLIEPSPYQPRTRFLQTALEELAQSIRSTGIIQPLVVRRRGQHYQLLAGERRWRAAQLAALGRVPVIIRDVPEEKALEITLVENLQREDLNPIEQAAAFDRLMSEFHLTQEQVAERTGKDRATVANALRLLRIEQPIREMVEDGRLSASHARALLSIDDAGRRLSLARRASRGGLTVRQLERLATKRRTVQPPAAAAALDPNVRAALEEIQQTLGTRVSVNPPTKKHPGELLIEYYNDSDLDRIYRHIVRD